MRVLGVALRPVPTALFALTALTQIVAIGLALGLEPAYDTFVYALNSVALAGAGALVASRYPANPIGWLFCGIALQSSLCTDLVQGWGLRAEEEGWPGGPTLEWIVLWSWLPAALGFVAAYLLFPDGRLPGPRWRSVLWLGAAGVVLMIPGCSLSPARGGEFAGGHNPITIDGPLPGVLFVTGSILFIAAWVLAICAIGGRFRRSRGVERQQLKWFAFSGACVAVTLPIAFPLWDRTEAVRVLVAVALVAVPLSACVAILRYRLYDIDVVINRALVYGAVTVTLAATYVLIVLVAGTALGRGSATAAAVATLVVAVAFRPLRARVQDRVDRRFSRARYDALHRVAAFLDEVRAGRTAPEEVEAVLRDVLHDPRLELRFLLPASDRHVDVRGAPALDTAGDGRVRTVVERAGIPLGVVLHDPAAQERPDMLRRVVEAAGLAIEIVRLRVELRSQLDELAASRARIVAAGDAERRRIERDLHDGSQARLVSIGLALRHAQHELGPGEPARATLDDALVQVTVAIRELRELARGLRPPQLAAGLGPALQELASRSALPVQLDATAERFPEEVEAAAYFIACEGLTNAAKHARASSVRLSARRENGSLVLCVADDGVGGAAPSQGSGLSGLYDRVGAQGGTLRIRSDAGHGTSLVAELPCGS